MPIYFAYGSNMDLEQLAGRLARENHRLLGRWSGRLDSHRLIFNKRSSLDPSVGYANIEPAPGQVVEGTLNALTPDGLELLDRIELVPAHYRRVCVEVFDRKAGRAAVAFAYVAQPEMISSTVRPTRDYIDRLLAGGDLLPADYLDRLKVLACRE